MIEVFYFFFFQSLGTYMPYLGPYLRGLALSGRQISTILSVTPVMAMAVPLGWAWIADRTRRHARVLQVVCAGACLGIFPLIFARRFPTILASWAAYGVFSVAIGGLADSLAIARVRGGADYGRMRFWGSLGFLVAALAGGALLAVRGARPADPLVPTLMWLALAAAFVASLRLKGTGEVSARPRLGDVGTLLADRRLRLLLVAGPLHWICSAPYNLYFGIFLRDLRLSPLVSGLSFSIGMAGEMTMLLLFRRLRARAGLEEMLAVSFAASAVRWLAIANVHATGVLMALQVLHGFTFGLFWGAGIALVSESVPPALRATGQALFVMAINLGTAAGNVATGFLYDKGGAQTLFLYAAAGELLPLALALRARRMRQAAVQPEVPPVGPPVVPPVLDATAGDSGPVS
jgi:MFS transporter, PPP family, 3-phenylpropionic acid transporter